MSKTIDLSVIILSYNTVDLTRMCLKTVFASALKQYSMEVILCDNGSTDESISMVKREFPKVTIINNKKNLGFAAGNNPGIRNATGRHILLLNSDTEVSPNALAVMIDYMDNHKEVGAATCKLLLPNGSIDPACHRGFPSPWVAFTYMAKLEALFPRSTFFGAYHQGYKDLSTIHEVDCISGAFFLLRRRVIDQVGLLDEDYFMYGEDIDWAYRIRKAGWRIIYNPTVTILHKKKQSGRLNIVKRRRTVSDVYFHTYNWLFYKKHYERSSGPVIAFFVNSFYSIRLFLLKKLGV